MQFRTLMLLAGLISISPLWANDVWADDDPYLWLEGVDDEKALDWVRAENAATAKRLKANPLVEELYTEAKAVLNSASRLPDVHQEGDCLYNLWRDEKNPRGEFRRTSLPRFATDNPEREVVIDIDALSAKEDKHLVINGLSFLP